MSGRRLGVWRVPSPQNPPLVAPLMGPPAPATRVPSPPLRLCPGARGSGVTPHPVCPAVAICTRSEMEDFLSEAVCMKEFDHPNVMKLLGERPPPGHGTHRGNGAGLPGGGTAGLMALAAPSPSRTPGRGGERLQSGPGGTDGLGKQRGSWGAGAPGRRLGWGREVSLGKQMWEGETGTQGSRPGNWALDSLPRRVMPWLHRARVQALPPPLPHG